MKYADNEWHKNLTNVNIGIFLKTEDCEGGGGSSFIRVNTVFKGETNLIVHCYIF
jgi:hypothetical protein